MLAKKITVQSLATPKGFTFSRFFTISKTTVSVAIGIISPDELIRQHLPPMLLIHSKVDQNVPYSSAQRFVELSRAAGNPVEFKTLDEGGHFIFDDPRYVQQVFAGEKHF